MILLIAFFACLCAVTAERQYTTRELDQQSGLERECKGYASPYPTFKFIAVAGFGLFSGGALAIQDPLASALLSSL